MQNKYAEFCEPSAQVRPTFRAALYIRLSREDGDKTESYSVTSQRAILKEFLKLHPDIALYDEYVDDGWSGTSFDRPDFNRMMEDIRSGKVNCVIVKDLSRFGRNYADAGYYLDNVFVRLRVRFIALNNGIDTASGNMNAATQCISVGVTNVINESLAATTSVNVRGTLNVNRAQGKFIGSFACYGYAKDPEDHHKLVIDEDAAVVVRMIFERFLSGESILGITKDLNTMGIPNPSTYKKWKGMNYRHSSKNNDGLWCDRTVRRILGNEMYIGNMVQGKNTTVSYKIRQCRAIPKEDWVIVENTHPAIIDKDTFARVQGLFNRGIRKPPQSSYVDLFAGMVRCADCGRAMSKKTNNHSYGTYRYYRCTTSHKMNKSACTGHTIRIDKLEKAVLRYIQTMIALATEYEDILESLRNNTRKHESAHITKTLAAQLAERKKCVEMMADLYPDLKSGLITQEEYLTLKERLQSKVTSLDKTIANLEAAAEEQKNGLGGENDFIANFKKYGNTDRLTRPMVTELIEEILVHEGGSITIRIKFEDALAQLVEYVEMNRENIKSA